MPRTTEQIYKELLAKGDAAQQQANDILSAYDSRPAFSYNANADSAYKAVRDQYVHQGQRAMQDTMGQAAGLTGGYNNSYAQAVGNQAYNEWLTKLSGVGVEMANQARAAYDAEGQRMLDRYGLALNAANQAYAQGRDALADQRYDQEQARAQISAMIQMGQMPSDGLIAASGMNPADVKAMVSAYAAQLAAANAGKSGSTPSKTPKGDDPYTPPAQTPKQAAGQISTGAATGAILGAAAAASGKQDNATYTDLANMIRQSNDVNSPTAGTTKRLRNEILDAYQAGKITAAQAEQLLYDIGLKK